MRAAFHALWLSQTSRHPVFSINNEIGMQIFRSEFEIGM